MATDELTLGALLKGLVEIHDRQIDRIERYQNECLIPFDALVVHDTDEYGDCHAVGNAIPRQWPPVQRYSLQDYIDSVLDKMGFMR